ncbi:MAG: hypothetical protein O3A63_20690 [Proteobacteria bacterium]|nr:hypothetical protein [Pseudomonadota bacterium]
MKHQIVSEEALRELMGDPVHQLVVVKGTPILTDPLQRYIERSPFACLATYGKDGTCDRLDSIINIIHQPNLSLPVEVVAG